MTDKVMTYPDAPTCTEQKAAVFKRYQADQLALRGDPALDLYAGARGPHGERVPLPVQITTSYSDAPPPKFADPEHPTAKELSDYAAASAVQMVVDATVEAMQGAKVDVSGKQVTIDVSTAVVPAAAAETAIGG